MGAQIPILGAQRFDHVAITVGDLNRSLDFYTRLLGLRHVETRVLNETVVYRLFGLTGVRVLCAELCAGYSDKLELFHFDPGRPGGEKADFNRVGIQHIAFRTPDLDETGRRLSLAGVEVIAEPTSVGNGARVAFIRDPDGTIVELVESPFSFTMIGRTYLFVSKALRRLARSREAVLGTSMPRQTQK